MAPRDEHGPEEERHRDLRALPLALAHLSVRSASAARVTESLVDLYIDPSLSKLKRFLKNYRKAIS